MKKKDCLRWAEALINGKHKKLRGYMSDGCEQNAPSAMCCLGVANEEFKVPGWKRDRPGFLACTLRDAGVFKKDSPFIFDVEASVINDGKLDPDIAGIHEKGLTHEQIGILLLLAIESGEYRNI